MMIDLAKLFAALDRDPRPRLCLLDVCRDFFYGDNGHGVMACVAICRQSENEACP